MKSTIKTVAIRRKREGKTNYRKRIKLLASGKPRLVVRPTLKSVIAQIVSYGQKGDRVEIGVTAYALEKYGWTMHKGNIPAAYLTGYRLGKLAKAKGISSAVLDTGLTTPVKSGRIYACVVGVRDAGVSVPADGQVLPSVERIRGDHIAAYAKMKKDDLMKKSADIAQLFEKVKKALEREQ